MNDERAESLFEDLLVAVQEGVMTITLHRPQSFNALRSDTLEELLDAVVAGEEDPEVGALVITGSSEARKPAFAAGADIGEMADMGPLELREFGRLGQEIFMQIETLSKPVIAAINGLALGGGMELAMACHIRYAAEGARLGQPEINLGLIPGFGGSQRLPRLLGRGPALEMLLSGEPITAEEAFRLGLLNKVFKPEELLAKTQALGRKLASKAPIARARILDIVSRGAGLPLEAALQMEADLFGGMASTEDTREGLQAFLEKRKPAWKGC